MAGSGMRGMRLARQSVGQVAVALIKPLISFRQAVTLATACVLCALFAMAGILVVLLTGHSAQMGSSVARDMPMGRASYEAAKAMFLDLQLHDLEVGHERLTTWAWHLAEREIELAARELQETQEGQAREIAGRKAALTELHGSVARVEGSVARIVGLKQDEARHVELLRRYIGVRSALAAGGEPGLETVDLDLRDLSAIDVELSEVEGTLQDRIGKLEGMAASIEVWKRGIRSLGSVARHAPHGLPVQGPVTSGFGPRLDPITGDPAFHTGIDIAASVYTPVRATESGLVAMAGNFGNYGLAVLVAHGSGWNTLYGHCSCLLVEVGDTVQRGRAVCPA